MKKLFSTLFLLGGLTLSFFAFKPASTPMQFETISSDINVGSIVSYSKNGKTIDSTTANTVARFGVIGNPYTKGEMFTAYAVIKMTIKGDARVSDFQAQAQVVAEAYRKKNYPDVK